jgi:hypothetical protein
MALAALVCAAAAWTMRWLISSDGDVSGWRAAFALAAGIGAAIVSYGAASAVLRLEEWHELLARFKRRSGARDRPDS